MTELAPTIGLKMKENFHSRLQMSSAHRLLLLQKILLDPKYQQIFFHHGINIFPLKGA